jgi:alkanesulfonate monooxygenase SsuD/methylene tetrahydromethanopterin reductase-like flavin-dependent oxidoreductase (luciferase family)
VRHHLDELPRDVFESVWLSDHLVPGQVTAPPEWDTLECMTATIHFATAYPQYRYGQIVLGNSFRPPGLLGKMFATLAALSPARLILGIGAGWMESEYRMYGYPYPPPAIRIQELRDAVQVCRALWSESPASYTGRHFTLDRAYANPLPKEPPIIMIGGSVEQLTLRVVARYADWWNASAGTPEELHKKVVVLRDHCQQVGRDVDDILINWQSQCVAIADTTAEATALAERHFFHGRGSVVGTPDQVRARLQGMIDAGVRDFIFRFADFPRMDGVHRFAQEVAPNLRV